MDHLTANWLATSKLAPARPRGDTLHARQGGPPLAAPALGAYVGIGVPTIRTRARGTSAKTITKITSETSTGVPTLSKLETSILHSSTGSWTTVTCIGISCKDGIMTCALVQ